MENEERAADLNIQVEPAYERIDHWIVLTTNGATPRVLKNEPGRLAANEISLKLRLLVPKRVKRLAQTIVVRMPDELTHVANIEVSVPQFSEEPRE